MKTFGIEKGRLARAVEDSEVKNFLLSCHSEFQALYEEGLEKEFFKTFRNWIQASRLNQFSGLSEKNYPYATYVHGTSQAFDHFFRQYGRKRIRFFKGEFAYHKIYCGDVIDWMFVEDAPLESGDAVIVSVPFSDTGGLHAQLQDVLAQCQKLSIPVMIDAAYVGISQDITFDFSHPAIETVTSSLSKTFFGAAHLRAGIRLERTFRNDPIDFFNSVGMFSRLGAKLGTRLMQKFSCDFIPEKYRQLQLAVCQDLSLTPSQSVLFGLGDARYAALNRGGVPNRVCISSLLTGINRE
ncbi:MAG: hypothetical protein J0L82_16935 [Deltaproteobacteria bacterium]|jgi:hypothetical protein|nr:hypothetical protein [Deltaproteobacteria bacterium]